MSAGSAPRHSDLQARVVDLRPGVERFLASRRKGREDDDSLEDEVQVVMTEAVASLSSYREDEGDLKSWVLGIAANIAKRAERTRQRDASLATEDGAVSALSPNASPERIARMYELRRKVGHVFQTMPEPLFMVLYLVCIEEKSHQETAELLGITEEASRKRLPPCRMGFLMLRRARFSFCLMVGLGIGTGGCSSSPYVAVGECDPDAPFPDPWCLPADAGPDAADAGSDADSLIDPGTPAPQSYCSGRCLPEPSDDFAGSWPRPPLLLWVGPRALAPTSCDEARKATGLPEDVVFFEKYRRFTGLIAPPAECEACTCPMSEGTCTGLPTTLEVRASTCAEGDASSLPFGGPDGWDGACTSANALPSGAQCGGEPCAQSVYASPLPGPSSEACPISSTPPAFVKTTDWETAGVACEAKEIAEPCNPSTYRCMHNAPLPWLQCVALDGIHEACPGNYTYARYELYGEEPTDSRGCTTCACGGTPVGSACLGTLRLYGDGACAVPADNVGLSSYGEQCVNVYPVGRALGGKAITDLAYSPGICLSTGGDPTGSAERDPAQAVTFCCRSPFDDAAQPPK